MGPNKDATNIDLEIQEAEEFLSEEQISLIKSIVEDEVNGFARNNGATSSSMWNASSLRPSLRSLGLGRDSTETRSDEAEDDADEVDEEADVNENDEIIKDNSENEPQSVANGDEIILGEVNNGASTSKELGEEIFLIEFFFFEKNF